MSKKDDPKFGWLQTLATAAPLFPGMGNPCLSKECIHAAIWSSEFENRYPRDDLAQLPTGDPRETTNDEALTHDRCSNYVVELEYAKELYKETQEAFGHWDTKLEAGIKLATGFAAVVGASRVFMIPISAEIKISISLLLAGSLLCLFGLFTAPRQAPPSIKDVLERTINGQCQSDREQRARICMSLYPTIAAMYEVIKWKASWYARAMVLGIWPGIVASIYWLSSANPAAAT